jgi:hypothetical protein
MNSWATLIGIASIGLLMACTSHVEPRYRYRVPTVLVRMSGADIKDVDVEYWYETYQGARVFGQSTAKASMLWNSKLEAIEIYGSSISTDSPSPPKMTIRIRHMLKSQDIVIMGVDISASNTHPPSVERTIDWNG